MSLGYLGYLKIEDKYLLANSTGLNRQVNPLISQGVWGAGWYNAAMETSYADSQQSFEGAVQFELQGDPDLWTLVSDWLINERVYAKSIEISPNGIQRYKYTKETNDCRSGVWMKSASFNIDSGSLITVNSNLMALKRAEEITGTTYKNLRVGPGRPTSPLNPAPHNRNPLPGWAAKAEIGWPGAPAFWSDTNCAGLVMTTASVTVENNTQIIRGCTGDPNPVAVLQGAMQVSGSITLWRDGPIPDPYGQPGTPFTASDAYLNISLGSVNPLGFEIAHLLLTSDAHDVQGQNTPSTRVFGFSGLGNGEEPPFKMTTS